MRNVIICSDLHDEEVTLTESALIAQVDALGLIPVADEAQAVVVEGWVTMADAFLKTLDALSNDKTNPALVERYKIERRALRDSINLHRTWKQRHGGKVAV